MSDDAQVVMLPKEPLHPQIIAPPVPPVESDGLGDGAQPGSPGPGLRKIWTKPRKARSKPVKAQSKPRKVGS